MPNNPVNIPKQPQPPVTPPAQQPDDKKEVRLIEKLLEINIGFSMVLGGILLFFLVMVFNWKFNFSGYLSQENGVMSSPSPTPGKMVIANKPSAAPYVPGTMYINSQLVDIQKTFSIPAPQIKLTIKGQLKKEVFGFLPYWVIDKADQINIDLLTAVSYFGLEIDGEGNVVKNNLESEALEPWVRWQNDPKLAEFIKRAKKNRTKVYLTLKSFKNSNIERLVLSKEASNNFIENALYLMNSKSLDGINIDFEYYGTPDPKVRDAFSLLIANLNRELKRQYPKSILTVDTYASAASASQLYDVELLAANCDAIVVMGYDFHTPRSSKAGPLAPMGGYGYSVTGLLNSFLEKVPAHKLIWAVGYYGYDWPVSENSLNASVVGQASDVRIYPYANIADATKKTKLEWDENGQAPWYSYIDNTGTTRVVHFENTRSLGIKYDFINQKQLAGVGIWALGMDGKNLELMQLIADKFAY